MITASLKMSVRSCYLKIRFKKKKIIGRKPADNQFQEIKFKIKG